MPLFADQVEVRLQFALKRFAGHTHRAVVNLFYKVPVVYRSRSVNLGAALKRGNNWKQIVGWNQPKAELRDVSERLFFAGSLLRMLFLSLKHGYRIEM